MGFSNKRTKIKRHNGNRMLVTASKLAGCTYEEEAGWTAWRWFMKNPQGYWHGGKPTEIAHAKDYLAGKGGIIITTITMPLDEGNEQ